MTRYATCGHQLDGTEPVNCDTCNPDPLDRILTTRELHVVLLASAGYGRRTGSQALGISEDAWRWRLAAAKRKLGQQHTDQEDP